MKIKDWLTSNSQKLAASNIPSANLDVELILSHILGVERTFLHAHPDQELANDQQIEADKLLKRRLNREPIAYLVGYKYFYGRKFIVNSNTLIPRPESETIIEQLKILSANRQIKTLCDVGTGSGCLGITTKLELPFLDITLADISAEALEMAKQNAKSLGANINLVQSNLLSKINTKLDIIVANLPYVDKSWPRSPETDYEPSLALFADDSGLSLIKQLIDHTPQKLNENGLLFLEADPVQHQTIIEYAKQFKPVKVYDYTVILQKI